ncbi:unnamed protein product [Spodoptera littoralis]|uniref:Uncharacterized protein n=1 Tax=Spodoptera littoralis TaxID=7109 RepID=A0A9P0N303_SPOLI|nr:unnamed protein product [Spodoptera littoralis]CAH1639653.1 unnamed protein product [Spodoptera littoralis]
MVEDKVGLDMVDMEWGMAEQEQDMENIHHQDTQNTASDHYTMLHMALYCRGNKRRKAALFCPTCPAILPCGTGPCRYSCPPPCPCCQPCCPPPVPCTPCPPCKCCPVFRQCPAPVIPDCVPPIVPILPPCRPRRCPPPEPCPPPPPPPVCCPPVLPCAPPPPPCDPPPVCPCPEPTPCYQPVLPCCNPQCPPPIIPKQRPICPRAPPCPYPCLPVCRSCCPHCELDPVTRRRPLIVHDSVFHTRKTGLPAECFTRTSPNIRYKVENYVRQGPYSCCWHPVPVPLC